MQAAGAKKPLTLWDVLVCLSRQLRRGKENGTAALSYHQRQPDSPAPESVFHPTAHLFRPETLPLLLSPHPPWQLPVPQGDTQGTGFCATPACEEFKDMDIVNLP